MVDREALAQMLTTLVNREPQAAVALVDAMQDIETDGWYLYITLAEGSIASKILQCDAQAVNIISGAAIEAFGVIDVFYLDGVNRYNRLLH